MDDRACSQNRMVNTTLNDLMNLMFVDENFYARVSLEQTGRPEEKMDYVTITLFHPHP
jgi:hypothetical protein